MDKYYVLLNDDADFFCMSHGDKAGKMTVDTSECMSSAIILTDMESAVLFAQHIMDSIAKVDMVQIRSFTVERLFQEREIYRDGEK